MRRLGAAARCNTCARWHSDAALRCALRLAPCKRATNMLTVLANLRPCGALPDPYSGREAALYGAGVIRLAEIGHKLRAHLLHLDSILAFHGCLLALAIGSKAQGYQINSARLIRYVGAPSLATIRLNNEI